MTDTYENLHNIMDKKIQEMELFRLLLQQQPKAEEMNEDGVESSAENIYLFSVVLQRGISNGYDEKEFISQILDFHKSGYVTLSVSDENDPEELIRAKAYDNVQIYLNEQKLLPILLNDSLFLNTFIQDLMSSLQKQKVIWDSYDSNRAEMIRQHQEVKKWHEESASMRESWEKARKADEEARKVQAESLKEEVQSITKKKVDGLLEDELKLRGKIGSAMQDMQKDIIQFMGIFIAIFALLGLNISNAGRWSMADLFHINLIITASMATLLFLISVILNGIKDSRTRWMGILTVALWVLSVIRFFPFPIRI